MVPSSFSLVYSVSTDYIDTVPNPLGHPQPSIYNLHPISDLRVVPYSSLSNHISCILKEREYLLWAICLERPPQQMFIELLLSDRT